MTTVNNGHGRIELRQLRASTELNASLAATWTSVAQVFAIERALVRNGQATHAGVDGITSLPATVADPERVRMVVRRQWHLENRVHGRRDVTHGEDGGQVKQHHAAQVLSALNNGVLMLMDHRGVANVTAQMREFAANPLAAVALVLGTL